MRNSLLALILLLLTQMYGQKKYVFDTALIYEDTVRNVTLNYLINSNANNYNLRFDDYRDSTNVSFFFIDYDGLVVNAKTKKEAFYKAETMVSDCESAYGFSKTGESKTKNYTFVHFKDTLLNDTLHYHYAIKSNKSIKYQKRKKIVAAHFIVAKDSENLVPFLYHSLMFYEWKEEKNIPDGLAKIVYLVNVEGHIIEKLKLKKKVKTERFLTVPDECDYTNPEIRNKKFTLKKVGQ